MEYRQGGLYVVQRNRSRDDINGDLKAIDRRLFVEKQRTFAGEEVWCVCLEVGGSVGVHTVFEWRDDDNRPIELSSGIVERMRKMNYSSDGLVDRVMQQNAERIESKKRENQEVWEEIGKDGDKRMSSGYSALLPRSPGLVAARRRARRRGLIG